MKYVITRSVLTDTFWGRCYVRPIFQTGNGGIRKWKRLVQGLQLASSGDGRVILGYGPFRFTVLHFHKYFSNSHSTKNSTVWHWGYKMNWALGILRRKDMYLPKRIGFQRGDQCVNKPHFVSSSASVLMQLSGEAGEGAMIFSKASAQELSSLVETAL